VQVTILRRVRSDTADRTLHLADIVVSYALLVAIAGLMVLPFLWMLSSSLKPEGDVFLFPIEWIPSSPEWGNYRQVFESMPFALFTYNSFKIAILATIGQVITCTLAAYAFARFQFAGRDTLFVILLATMMIPGQVTFIPVFIIMKTIGWVDTHQALIVPWWFGGAFGTFLLRQFFLTLPTELDDAAKIDGSGRLGILLKIIVPLSKPALATLAIFVFMSNWNDLLGPVIYLSTRSKMTLTVGLALMHGLYQTQWNLLMAGALISVVPILVLYIVAQQYFVQGIALSGIKE
jgi:multiple sugar transport system permease protein